MMEIEPMVLHGECLEFLREIPDNTIDAIITDPPYGLSNTEPAHVVEAITQWANGNREFVPHKKGGFMGKEWDSFVPPPAVWDECLRILKPGGHVLTFAGTRTMDLMTLGLRLAGFDIRDSLAWLYGSGFPKSMNVSKAIDKAARGVPQGGVDPTSPNHGKYRTTTTEGKRWDGDSGQGYGAGGSRFLTEAGRASGSATAHVESGGAETAVSPLGHGVVDEAAPWQGWGTALKPAFEPIIMARKPFKGTVAKNVLEHGTGALNIDATRIGMSEADAEYISERIGGFNNTQSIGGKGILGGGETMDRAESYDPTKGRWPANVILGHTEDCEQVGTRSERVGGGAKGVGGNSIYGDLGGYKSGDGWTGGEVESEVWNCAPGCQVAELDAQSGTLAAGNHPARRGGDRDESVYALGHNGTQGKRRPTETGGASRFFYCAKAPKRERPVIEHEDGTRTAHPTVKPLALMRWLIRLVTPPGGLVLDPFVGSGTTIEAGMLEGFEVWGIEGEDDYLPLIQQRIDRVMGAQA